MLTYLNPFAIFLTSIVKTFPRRRQGLLASLSSTSLSDGDFLVTSMVLSSSSSACKALPQALAQSIKPISTTSTELLRMIANVKTGAYGLLFIKLSQPDWCNSWVKLHLNCIITHKMLPHKMLHKTHIQLYNSYLNLIKKTTRPAKETMKQLSGAVT